MPGLSKASSKARPFALLSPVTICAFFRNSRLLQIRPDLLSSSSELRGGITALVGTEEISDLFLAIVIVIFRLKYFLYYLIRVMTAKIHTFSL